MSELAAFGKRLGDVVDGDAQRRMLNKAGAAGKKSALDAAARDLGGDRSFSGMRRRTKLNAGYDLRGDSEVVINFRPAGLWKLASEGRRRSGAIVPRKRGGKKALMTPHGPRARSSYGRSRGSHTFDDAVRDAQREIPKAAFRQFQDEVRKVVR